MQLFCTFLVRSSGHSHGWQQLRTWQQSAIELANLYFSMGRGRISGRPATRPLTPSVSRFTNYMLGEEASNIFLMIQMYLNSFLGKLRSQLFNCVIVQLLASGGEYFHTSRCGQIDQYGDTCAAAESSVPLVGTKVVSKTMSYKWSEPCASSHVFSSKEPAPKCSTDSRWFQINYFNLKLIVQINLHLNCAPSETPAEPENSDQCFFNIFCRCLQHRSLLVTSVINGI